MKKTPFGTLNLRDIAKGFFTAVTSAILTGAYTGLAAGQIPGGSDFKTMGLVGLGAGISYLLKNVLTNSNDQLMTPEK